MTEKQTYTFKELCQLYNVSADTFRKWLDPIKNKLINQNKRFRIFCQKDIDIIFSHLGKPSE